MIHYYSFVSLSEAQAEVPDGAATPAEIMPSAPNGKKGPPSQDIFWEHDGKEFVLSEVYDEELIEKTN